MAETPRKIVVVGTGRSGTKFVASVFAQCGLISGHEAVYNPLAVFSNWSNHVNGRDWQVESSWLAVPHLPIEDAVIVHLVRHPLATITSHLNIGVFQHDPQSNPYTAYKKMFCPEAFSYERHADMAARFYVSWNRMIEPHRQHFWKLEDLQAADFAEALNDAGLRKPPRGIEDAIGRVPKNMNTVKKKRSPVKLEWLADSVRGPLIEIAEEYGYELT